MFRRVLVTGGAGFIGCYVCRRLRDAGYEAIAFDNLSIGRRERLPEGVTFVEGDVLDTVALRACAREVDAVIHLAARVGIRHSGDTPLEEVRQNIVGTASAVEACRGTGVRRFIFASSMAVYAEGRGRPIPEDYPTEPVSAYGVCKLASEKLLFALAPAMGIEPLALRLFNTYGRGQSFTREVGVLTIFINMLAAGERPLIYGDGEQARDFVWVEDVAEAFRLALEGDVSGRAINIGSGRAVTVNEVARMVCEAFGREVDFVRAPANPAELRYSVADIGLARRLLGYEPRGDLAAEIRRLVAETKAARAYGRPEE